jgi:GNAT superfamily N-acetyltransferase
MNRIRAAAVADAADIARLSAQLGYAAEAAVFEDRLQRIAAMPTHAVLVCEGEAGGLVGFIGAEHRLMIESGDRAEIVALVVDADLRRGGTGRRLVAAAEDWARARGIDRVLVRSNIARDEAHDFYPALGYARSKTQHVYLRQL